jgi:hypothetical protein
MRDMNYGFRDFLNQGARGLQIYADGMNKSSCFTSILINGEYANPKVVEKPT